MYKIKMLRGTIFCAPINYSKKFVDSLSGLVDGYMPLLVRDNGALPILPVWQLTSPDEKEVLAFAGDKIDFVSMVEQEMDDAGIKVFADRCKAIFEKIVTVTGNICTRVAFAPSTIITEGREPPSELFSRLFNIRRFGESQLASSNVSQVYRVSKRIGAKDVTINHVANFHVVSEMQDISRIRECYLCDFDINTAASPDNKFTESDINDFFDNAPDYFKTFFHVYSA